LVTGTPPPCGLWNHVVRGKTGKILGLQSVRGKILETNQLGPYRPQLTRSNTMFGIKRNVSEIKKKTKERAKAFPIWEFALTQSASHGKDRQLRAFG